MSAYVVDKEVIQYIIEAAKTYKCNVEKDLVPGIVMDWQRVSEMTPDQIDALGQALWDANVRSVEYRYQDSDNSDGLPGEDTSKPRDDRFYYVHGEPIFDTITVAQTMRTLHHYAYQTCETDDREKTLVFRFVMAMAWNVATYVQGYEQTKWGAPAPNPRLVSLTAMARKGRLK
jgi:hypothetical protein